ncbi:MAG: hypothetical protein V3T72_08990 [Thermoanaerobaculia bacterium]
MFILVVAPAAQALEVAEVNGASLNCLFAAADPAGGGCPWVVASDQTPTFPVPFAAGEGRLQSRIMTEGAAGTPGEGLIAYEYRVDLSDVRGITAAACVSRLTVQFGDFTRFDFDEDRALEDAFVITAAAIGSVRPSRIDRVGDTVNFIFFPGVCPGESSYFMGLVSTEPPVAVTAEISHTLSGETVELEVRAPAATGGGGRPARDCLVPGFGTVPIPHFVPLCRCLEDRSVREFHCRLFHPDFLLDRRIPWPLRAGEPFDVEWVLEPLAEMSGPLVVAEELPKSFTLVGQKPELEFVPTPLGQTAAARMQVSATAAGEFETRGKVTSADGESVPLQLAFKVEESEQPPAAGFQLQYWIVAGILALLVILWLLKRRRN